MIDIHQNRSISPFLTPFDHFHFRPTSGLLHNLNFLTRQYTGYTDWRENVNQDVFSHSFMFYFLPYRWICGGGIFCLQVVTFFQLGGDDDDDDHDADYDDDYDNSDNVLFRLESTGTHPLSLSPSMSLSSAPS